MAEHAQSVEQCDRDAAAGYARHSSSWPDGVPPHAIESGHPHGDATELVQAFARHRIAQHTADQQEVQRLREALRTLISAADSMGDLTNCGLADEAILKARTALGDRP